MPLFEISNEKMLTVTFKEALSPDAVLFEKINKNPNIMLSCARSVDNDRVLFFDKIGTKPLYGFFDEKVFSSDELRIMLLDMIRTVKLLLEHGFSENVILLDPQYVFVSVYDSRPKFVCLPVLSEENKKADSSKASGSSGKSADEESALAASSQTGQIAAFFRDVILHVSTSNAFTLTGLVLEETAKKRFSISRLETQIENFTDITVRDLDKCRSKTRLLSILLPLLTGVLTALLMIAGFHVALNAYIEMDLIAYLCAAGGAVVVAVIGILLTQPPREKKIEQRDEIVYSYTNSEMEKLKAEQKDQEIVEARVLARKAEHLDLQTAVANAVTGSGVIVFEQQSAPVPRQSAPVPRQPAPAPRVPQAAQYIPTPQPAAPVQPASRVPQAAQYIPTPQPAAPAQPAPTPRQSAAAGKPVPAPDAKSRASYEPKSIDNLQILSGDTEHLEDEDEERKTNLLNFGRASVSQNQYLRGASPYLVSVSSPSRKIMLSSEQFTVGKSPECSLVIPVETVSRHHAVISVTPLGCSVTDHSTNGTYINGKRIQKGIPTAVKNGDTVSFNREAYRFFDR